MIVPWFSEVQRLRDNSWIVVLWILLMFGPLAFVYYGFFQQVVLGNAWGDIPMSDSGLILFTLFLTVCTGGATFLFTSLTMETKIDEQGIHYRMFPIKWRWRLITTPEIDQYSFADKFGFFDGGGIGHHRNTFKKLTSYKMFSGRHIDIRLKNGQRLLLGTENREGMEMAMRKLFNRE